MNISGATLLAEYRRAKADWPFIEPVEKAHGLPALLLYAVGSRETNLRNIKGGSAPAMTAMSAGAAAPSSTASWTGTYTVRPGDSLSAIAATHHTTVAALVARNGIKDPNRIAVGQVLRLP